MMNLEEAMELIEKLIYDDIGLTSKEREAWNLIVKECTRQE